MKNYIILAGSAMTPLDNWYAYIKAELEKTGANVCIPYLPQGEFMNYKSWARVIDSYKKVGMISKDTIIIAHDVACVFITKYLVTTKTAVSGVISVSPFCSILGMEQDSLNKSFLCKKELLSKIEKFVKFYHTVCSENDPIVSEQIFNEFSQSVGAKPHIFKNGGHFDFSSGKKEFKELLELIDSINKIV